ncbi:MAG: universal stress protein [Bacteroidia bacterium]
METILMPTDFSPAAENACKYAVELAKYFKARVILVHAYTMPITGADSGFAMNLNLDLKNDAEKKLFGVRDGIMKNNLSSIDVECITELGSVYDVVKNAVDSYKPDLIVMGIVGKAGKIKEHLIGSSAITVARNINVPTFIIPEGVAFRPISKISFACDMNNMEEIALTPMVKFFSKEFNAELEVVNVERPEEEVTVEKARTNLSIEERLMYIKHRTVFISENSVARGLEDYFHTHPTDLIILSPKKHHVFYWLFNESVTKELAFHGNTPILTIH